LVCWCAKLLLNTSTLKRIKNLAQKASSAQKSELNGIWLTFLLFARDLITDGYKSGETSSDLKRIGSVGAGKFRTCWDFTVTLGMPFSRWGAAPFIASPIPFSRDIWLGAQRDEALPTPQLAPHSFHLALRWWNEIAEDPRLTKSRIAAREGLSRACVTQVMNLLLLPIPIQ
jgi:hypothetical protein